MLNEECFIAEKIGSIKTLKQDIDRIRPIDLKVFDLVSDGLSCIGR